MTDNKDVLVGIHIYWGVNFKPDALEETIDFMIFIYILHECITAAIKSKG